MNINIISQWDKIIKEQNSNYVFNEKTEEILNCILSVCNDETLKEYKSLLKVESLTHDPKTQYELAKMLREMALDLHRIEYPHSPICQWFMEMYYSPALYWAIQAVEQNYLPAYNTERIIVELGGKDVKSNFELAKALLFKAANEGDIESQLKLAKEYTKTINTFNSAGRYVEYDPREATNWYYKIEQQQDPVSYQDLAEYYKSVDNYIKSNEYFNELIKLDDKNKKYHVDIIYNYLHMGNIHAAVSDILDLIEKNDDSLLTQIYQRLHPHGWMQIDNIMIEYHLLNTLVSNGSIKAKQWLKKKYKKSLFGNLKRSRRWDNSIYFD